jgi:hypothetical protein
MEDGKLKRGFLPLPRNAIAPGLAFPKPHFGERGKFGSEAKITPKPGLLRENGAWHPGKNRENHSKACVGRGQETQWNIE